MADAIPVADPALLAAQAKAGQAGVDAYNSAISTLQQQRQQAVQTAMQEAAMRGAPGGAVESQASTITTPYDQRIASLSQGLGSYQASQEARSSRMADYNAAVMAARELIPGQVQLAVAPINAQADYNVRRTQIEGEQNVAGIDAETRLALARMAAAAEAAKRKAAAGGGSGKKDKGLAITQTQLRSALTSQAAADVASAGQEIKQRQGENTVAAKLGVALEGMKAAAKKEADPTYSGQRNQSYWDTMAARYTGQAAQDWSRSQTMSGGLAKPTMAPRIVPKKDGVGFTIEGGLVPQLPTEDQTAKVRAAKEEADRQMAQLQAQLVQRRQQMTAVEAPIMANYQNKARQIIGQYTSSPYGWVTDEQAAGLSPLAQYLLKNAPGRFNSANSVDQMLLGSPYETGRTPYTDQPVYGTNPAANAAMAQAMKLAAGRMQDQGYDITDADIYGALGEGADTAYDVLAKQTGGRTAKEDIELDAKDQADYDRAVAAGNKEEADRIKAQAKANSDQAKTDEAGAERILVSKYGRTPPSSLGNAIDVLEAIQSPQGDVSAASVELGKILEGWDKDKPPTYTTLREELRKKGVRSDLWDLALYMKGYTSG